MKSPLPVSLWGALLCLSAGAICLAQEGPRFQVLIKDGSTATTEMQLPIDPVVRIQAQNMNVNNSIYFGLTVDGKRITCSPQGSIWTGTWVDGNMQNPVINNGVMAIIPLPKSPTGKERRGFMGSWTTNDIKFTQTIEIVPSKPVEKIANAKRKLDTVRISYLAENKGQKAREVAVRTNIDILVNNNDGALYLSPTTEPGKILNGIALEGKSLPHFLQVVENPDPKNPGFYGVMTFKFGNRVEGPSRVVLTNLGNVHNGQWDIQPMPAGDSACSIYWAKKVMKPGEKREMVWAYGGGIAADSETDGKVSLTLGGNLEPGKLFTLSAMVEDPVEGQSLELELPTGIECVDGPATQAVPMPTANGYSMVQWRGRVARPGNYELKVRSSTGVTQSKEVAIQPIGGN
jgi:hypothetical protein